MPRQYKWVLLLYCVNMLGCRVPESEVEKKGQGYVLSADPGVAVSARAHKMSKSRGNVVNPDDVVDAYGADSLRLYEMFMGPLRDTKVQCLTSRFSAHSSQMSGHFATDRIQAFGLRVLISQVGNCDRATSCHLLRL